MAWFIGQSAVMIGLAFTLGVLVGWIVWHRRPLSTVDTLATASATAADTNMAGAPAVPTDTAAASTHAAFVQAVSDQTVSDQDRAKVDESAADATDDPIERIWAGMKLADKSRRKEASPPAVPVAAVAVTPTPDVDQPPLPPIDDLARIEGIGPKIASALVEAGIRTYEQLAEAKPSELMMATRAASITFTPSISTWSQQATLLALGDEDGFKTLIDRLIAGREPAAKAAAEQTPDDLARIEGIGPKISAALISAGIRTYGQVADADVSTLEAAINKSGITFAPSIVTWSIQAKLLAAGDEDGFADLTQRLVAGREQAAKA